MGTTDPKLPAVTLVIEWENAIDVVDEWTAKAMVALARELAAVAPRMAARPRVMYLYDSRAVASGTIESVVDKVAPELRDAAELEIVPTEGLSYYKLKNYGAAHSRTDLTIFADSDALPEPGWLESLIAPFADPEVMAVGGFTRLAHEDLVSRAMALSWIFDLEDERKRTERRNSVHVNNLAVRTGFFREHPFPDLPLFKKQCVFWLQGITNEGHRYIRTADARAVHAPHPGLKYIAFRAWSSGWDNDFVAFHSHSKGRLGRIGHAFMHLGKKVGKAWYRILFRGGKVGLPVWQRPFALWVPLYYYGIVFAGQVSSSLTRTFGPLPPFRPLEPVST